MIQQFELIQRLKNYIPHLDENAINRAYVFAMKAHGSQMRASGDPYFSHPLEVAGILIDLRLDPASIITALLHDTVEDTSATLDEIEIAFGKEVMQLVDGVTKLTRIELQSEETKQAENFRKLVLAMSSDIRVLIVKLADRLHNMRTLHYVKNSSKQRRIARETTDIYAPLAERIGMHSIKDELEDLSFSIINPQGRESILSRLRYLHEVGGQHVETILLDLRQLMNSHNIEISLSGREKTPYSIWRKMQLYNIAFEQLSDIMAFRILVDTVPQCYQVLGILHSQYPLIPGRFKDYMSMPKSNGYQSLHTSIIGPLNQRIEVQIRTREMQQIAEYGVAAHWYYKQNQAEHISNAGDGHEKGAPPSKTAPMEGKHYAWLRGLLDILEHAHNPQEFLEHTKLEMFADQVFCFSPKGDVIALPKGATTVDFAYTLHSEIGDHTVAVRVNGRQVPLRTVLNNGDQVEIVTSHTQTPSPAWERFVITGKARTRIRKFVRQQQRSQFLELGKSLLKRAFEKENIDYTDAYLHQLGHAYDISVDDLILSVGQGHKTARDVVVKLKSLSNERGHALIDPDCEGESSRDQGESTISIQGLIPGMALHFSKCCHPIPGDTIVGIVSEGRGVHVHTFDCEYITHFKEPERLLHLSWSGHLSADERFVARISITFLNQQGNLARTLSMISNQKGNIANMRVLHRSTEFWEISVDTEVLGQEQLSSILAALRTSPIISKAERH